MRGDSLLLNQLAEQIELPEIAEKLSKVPLIEIPEGWDFMYRLSKQYPELYENMNDFREFLWPWEEFGVLTTDSSGAMWLCYFGIHQDGLEIACPSPKMDSLPIYRHHFRYWLMGKMTWTNLAFESFDFDGRLLGPLPVAQYVKNNPTFEAIYKASARKTQAAVLDSNIRLLRLLRIYLHHCYELGRQEVEIQRKHFRSKRGGICQKPWCASTGHIIYIRPPHYTGQRDYSGTDLRGKDHEPTGQHKAAHRRRSHLRWLRHPRYRNHPMYGKQIRIRESWIGDREWADVKGNTYRVVFD